ncbi:MAG TPA: ABC transporter permease [Planctomycetes bacterium]|nr:ABC transporter permease [Planctomycetota bacterium]
MYKYFLGLKFLLSRKINLLGMFGVLVAVWALITVLSIFKGFIREVNMQVRGAASDLVLIGHKMDRSYEEVEKLLLRDPNVRAVAPRISWFGLLYVRGGMMRGQYVGETEKGSRSTNFFRILGIDYMREKEVSGISHWLSAIPEEQLKVANLQDPFRIEARDLPKRDRGDFGQVPPGLLMSLDRIGNERIFARGRALTIASGRRIRNPETGKIEVQPIKRTFALAGAFHSGHYDFDNGTLLVDIEVLRSIFGHDPEDEDSLDIFNEVAIALHGDQDALGTSRRLNTLLKDHGISGKIFTWQQRQQKLLQAVSHEQGLMKLILFVLMVVASVLIFATLSMMVSEKIHDIGILSALGATRKGVATIFLLCGLTTALVGTVLGCVAGYFSCLYINPVNDYLWTHYGAGLFPPRLFGLEKIPYVLEFSWFLQVSLFALGTAFVFSLLPALRAARYDPVKALRHE